MQGMLEIRILATQVVESGKNQTWLEEVRKTHALCPNGRGTFRHIQADEATQGKTIRWIHKWISLHPKQRKLVLLVHLAQVICRQGQEQRNQYPVLLEAAEVKQEARPEPEDSG